MLQTFFAAQDGFKILAQCFAEISGNAVNMRFAAEIDPQIRHPHFIVAGFGQGTIFDHLIQHNLPALFAQFWPTQRVEVRRILQHTNQHGCLMQFKIFGGFAEIGIGGGFDAVGIVDKFSLIEVHREDFLLSVFSFQTHGNDPFFEFLHDPRQARTRFFGKQQFGQLLGNGTCSTGAAILEHHGFDHHPPQCLEIYPHVFIKTFVFSSN